MTVVTWKPNLKIMSNLCILTPNMKTNERLQITLITLIMFNNFQTFKHLCQYTVALAVTPREKYQWSVGPGSTETGHRPLPETAVAGQQLNGCGNYHLWHHYLHVRGVRIHKCSWFGFVRAKEVHLEGSAHTLKDDACKHKPISSFSYKYYRPYYGV